jgi:hypothetical protein
VNCEGQEHKAHYELRESDPEWALVRRSSDADDRNQGEDRGRDADDPSQREEGSGRARPGTSKDQRHRRDWKRAERNPDGEDQRVVHSDTVPLRNGEFKWKVLIELAATPT